MKDLADGSSSTGGCFRFALTIPISRILLSGLQAENVEDSGVEEAWRALKKRAWIRGGVDRKEMGLDRTE